MFSKLKEKLKAPATSRDVAKDLERENALLQLGRYDTQFLIDDSRSMTGSRWSEAREALAGLAKTALKYDKDGIEIFFLNAVDAAMTVKASLTDEDVRGLFASVKTSPGTPTGRRLKDLLTAYMDKLEATGAKGVKPLNLIVITDGEPSDDPASVIVEVASRLDAGNYPLAQVGIQFIQVGDDPWATKALKDLDNHLGAMNNVRDIVDTRPYTGQSLTSERLITMLLGGINRRVDKLENL